MKKPLFFLLILIYPTIQLFSQPDKDSLSSKLDLLPSKPISVGKGELSLLLYADFGYVAGPQRWRTYSDPIKGGDTVTDFGRRKYTSYPLYANSFSLAYGFLGATYYIPEKLKLSVSFHEGHLIDALYYLESASTRYIRESYAQYWFTPRFSTEMGIFISYFGFEVPMLRQNMNATRAYIADFEPDYEAGIRFNYKIKDWLYARAMILNGWQEIQDRNGKKGFVGVISVLKEKKIEGDFNVYVGDMREPLSTVRKMRYFFNPYYKIYFGKQKNFVVAPALDFALEEKGLKDRTGYNSMYGAALTFGFYPTEKTGIAARWEHVYDPENIVPELYTGTKNGWQSHSFTLTTEYIPFYELKLRSDLRWGFNRDAVFFDSNNVPTRYDYYWALIASFSL